MRWARSWRLAAVCLAVLGGMGRLALAQPPPPDAPPADASPAAPAPAPTVLLPPASDEAAEPESSAPAKPVPPPPPIRRSAAIMQALDKVTAETIRFEAPVNQPVRYKDLVFTVHVCEEGAPGQRGAAAHLEIDSQPKPSPGRAPAPSRQLFKGWMFANAPGLHPFEHPVYDAWLIACKAT